MLVLTRKSNQSIMIGDDIEVSVLSIMGEKVRIGIQAPRDIPVFRKEVYLEIQQENVAAGASARAEVDDNGKPDSRFRLPCEIASRTRLRRRYSAHHVIQRLEHRDRDHDRR
jgi:carbon storage regulator